MTEKTKLTLNNFFIYNDTFGSKEGEEEEKVLYYYPLRTNPDTVMKNVGLSEAIVKFTETFNPSHPCEVLNTEKTKQLYYQPEENFWMIMTVNVPYKCGIEGREYLSCEVQDSICLAVLRQAYAMAYLFMGPFTNLLNKDKTNTKDITSVIKIKLENFFNRYLHSLPLEHCDILDVFQGVQFLPLDKVTFLHVQCFINHVEAAFSNVDFSVFLYNEHLIWSGLEPEELQVVFRYLVNNLLLTQVEKESQTVATSLPNSVAARPSFLSFGLHFITTKLWECTVPPPPSFITGPTDLHSSSSTSSCSSSSGSSNNIGKIPRLHLKRSQPTPSIYQMIVYRANKATVCLFVKNSITLTMEMFRQLDEFLTPRITKLASEIAEYSSRQAAAANVNDSTSRFIYFNRMNLATKSTVHLDNRRSGNISVSTEVLRILADINYDHWKMVQAGNPTAETIIKTVNDYWVVGRLSNAREFYVVTQHKNANIAEINDEVKKICDKQLKSIFFHV